MKQMRMHCTEDKTIGVAMSKPPPSHLKHRTPMLLLLIDRLNPRNVEHANTSTLEAAREEMVFGVKAETLWAIIYPHTQPSMIRHAAHDARVRDCGGYSPGDANSYFWLPVSISQTRMVRSLLTVANSSLRPLSCATAMMLPK